jgi:hypothetical protein
MEPVMVLTWIARDGTSHGTDQDARHGSDHGTDQALTISGITGICTKVVFQTSSRCTALRKAGQDAAFVTLVAK